MKNRNLLSGILIALLFCIGCTRSYDGPPKNDAPLPEKLEGMYSGEHGTIRFLLTGQDTGEGIEYGTAEVHLTGLNKDGAVLDGEMDYSFTWDTFGSCRYDNATRFTLTQKGTKLSCSFSVSGIGNGTFRIVPFYAGDADGRTIEGLTEDVFTFALEKQEEN